MHEIYLQILTHARGMWRYRWLALAVAWGIAIAGWFAVYSLPDQYRAEARVYIDTKSVLKPLLQGLAVDTSVMSKVDMMTQALLSRPNLQKVAHETDLDLRAKTAKQRESMLDLLKHKIYIRGDRDNVYTIAYTDRERSMSLRVVQTLLNNFVEDSLGANRVDTNVAQKFLDEQIHEYETRLTAAEQRLAQFKQANVGTMPGEGGDYYTRLQAALTKLQQIDSDLKVAEKRRSQLKKQLEGEEPAFGMLTAPSQDDTSGPIDSKLDELRTQLNTMLLKYTDQHPDVIALKAVIAQLEAKKAQEQKATGAVRHEQALELNPVYQRMKIALSEADVDVATLRTQRNEQQQQVAELRKRVDTIPEVEANLSRLNRDYNVTKAQYEALVKRRESARLSEQAEQSSDDIKFRVIEPPMVPLNPIGPKRVLLLTIVLFGAFAAGGALAFVLSQLRPVFITRQTLREITGLPILGSVNQAWGPKEERRIRARHRAFVACTLLLVLCFGGVVAYHHAGVQFVQSVLTRT